MEARWRHVAALKDGIVTRGLMTYAGFRWLLRIMLANAAVQVVALWLIGPITLATTPITLFDFTYYYVAALTLRLNPHANIYDPRVMPAVASAHHIVMSSAPGPFNYPLLLPIALIPLSYLSFQAASVVWYLFNLLLWALNIALLADWMRHGLGGASGEASGRSARRDAGRAAIVLVVFIGLSYGPLIDAQILGQASMLMLTCFLLASWFERRGRPEIAGALLIIPTLIKLFPAFLIVYYVCRGRWRVALGAAVGLCVALVGMALVVGVGGVLSMRGVLQATSMGVLQTFHNQALARAPLWIAVESGGVPSATTALWGDALIALVALAIAALLYAIRRRAGSGQSEQGDAAFLGYAWALSGMLLITPVTWNHYDIWLLPGILYGLGYSVRRLTGGAGGVASASGSAWPWTLAIVGLLAALLFTGSDLPLGYDGNPTLSPGPFLLGHPLRPFFMLLRPLGALLVWLITGAMLVRLPSAPLTAPASSSRQGTSPSGAPAPKREWWRLLYPVALIALVGPLVLRILFAVIANAALAAAR